MKSVDMNVCLKLRQEMQTLKNELRDRGLKDLMK
jgi:hypothetical protein